jgi:PAS domain S-box-containing protein
MYLKKEIYELLKTDESIFDFIQESALDGLWYWDLEKPENEWMNAKFWMVLGYNPDEMPHKSSAWQEIINQNDLKLATENFTKHCENPNHPYDQIVRYTHKNGSLVWIRCRGMAIRDKNGKPIRMLGAHQDISDIKRNEQELLKAKEIALESEEKYRSLYDNAPLSYQSLDENGCFVDVNPMWTKTLGYELKEVIGKWFGDFLHPDSIEHFRKNFPAFKKRGHVSDVQFKIRRKDNTYILISFEGSIGYTPEGKFKHTYCVFKDITDIRQAELALKQSESKFRALFEKGPIGIAYHKMIYDSSGKSTDYFFLDANEAYQELTGVDPRGKLVTEAFPGIENDPFDWIGVFGKVARTGKTIRFESYLVPNQRWYDCVGYQNKPDHFVAAFFETTKRKKAEIQLKEINENLVKKNEEIELNNKRLESLFKISQYSPKSIQELLDFALSEAIKLTYSKIGYIYYYDESTKQFMLNSWSKEVMKECKVMNPQTIYELEKTGCWGEAVRQRKPIVINDYHEENPLKKGTPHGHVQLNKFLTIPVIIDNKIVAVCGVANKTTDYDNSDIRQLSLLMDSVWKISERLTLLTELTIAKEKAEESEEKLKSIFRVAPSGIGVVINRTFVEVNPKVCEMTGYLSEELLGKNARILYPTQEDYEFVGREKYKQIAEYGTGTVETRWQRKDGKIINIIMSSTPLDSSDLSKGISFTALDVTERIKAEQELIAAKEKTEESEARYHLAMKASSDGLFDWNLETNEIYYSPAWKKILGYKEHELPNDFSVWENTTDPEDVKRSWELQQKVITKQIDRFVMEFKMKHKDGYWVDILSRAEAFFNDSGKAVRFVGTHTDITERKQSELLLKTKSEEIAAQNEELNQANQELIAAKEKVEESEGKLKEAQRIAHMGNWELNIVTNELHWSDEIYRIFDCDPQSFNATFEAFLEFIHPDDREKVKTAYLNSLETKTEYQIEHRLITKNNQLKYVREKFSTTFDEHGVPLNSVGIVIDITEQKALESLIIKAKEKAEKSEKKLIEAQELSHVGSWEYFVDTDAVNWSKEMCNIFELSPDLPAPKYSEQAPFYTEESFAKLENAVQNCIQHEIPYEIELDIITTSGAIKQIISKGNVLKDINNKLIGCYGTAQDITERKIIERELVKAKEKAEESELQFRLIYENSKNPIMWTEAKTGKIIACNPASKILTEYESEELIGKPFTCLIPQEQLLETYSKYQKHQEIKKSKSIESQIITKSGKIKDVELSATNVELNGKEISQAIFKDITSRLQKEKELIVAKEKAEESDRLKSAFLANMSHEIRTPMNGILGFTNLLLNPDLNSKEKDSYIKIVQQSGQRMLNTVNDIVEISKIESGLISVNIKETDINKRLMELHRFFKAEAEKKGLNLIVDKLMPISEKNILADQNKLDSILTNLIKNAIKYTESGGINLGCQTKANVVEFYVKDTGIGIPKDRIEAIFNRFEQADIADTKAFEGSGLGLAIAKSYVEMLEGNIWVESVEGKGSVFYFTIPIKSK